MPPCTPPKWCTLQEGGRKFAQEIWAETLNFRPPRKFYNLTQKFRGPEIPPLGPEFLPLRLVYIKGGAGVEIPLGTSVHPRPPYFKPPPPPHQGPLRRLPSRRIPRISPVLAPLGVGVLFLHVVFAMDSGIAPNLSLSLGAFALDLVSFGLIRCSLKGACLEVVFGLVNLALNLVGANPIFLEFFVSCL
jgi:hypothetical protein